MTNLFFDYYDYINGVLVPTVCSIIFSVFLVALCIVSEIINISSKKAQPKLTVFFLLIIAILGLSLFNDLNRLNCGVWDLMFEKESDALEAEGVITDIEETNSDTFLYFNKTFSKKDCHAVRLTVNGKVYTCFNNGSLEKGEYIRFTYLSKSNFILAVNEADFEAGVSFSPFHHCLAKEDSL